MRVSHFYLSVFISLSLVVGCTGPQKKNASKKPSTYKPQIPRKPDAPLPDGELKAESLDIRQPLREWTRKHSSTKYSKLAQEAQKLLPKYGLLYIVNIQNLPEAYDGYRKLSLPDGKSLYFSTSNSYEGTCSELFTRVSVLGFENGNPIILTNKGPMTVPGLYLEKTLLRRSEEETAGTVLYRPNPEPPWNIGSDGTYMLIQYYLDMSYLENWWQRLSRRYRELRDERPYLIVRITDKGFRVETYEKTLLPAAYEQVNPNSENDPYLIRRIYKPRNIVVDFEGPCT